MIYILGKHKDMMLIRIKKRTQASWAIWLLILFPFGFGLLNELLGIPTMIRYLMDVAWGVLLILEFLNKRTLRHKETVYISLWCCVFAVYTLLIYVVQFQSPFYYLWGLRNSFRFYVAFLAFAVFLKPQEITEYLKVFDALYWINFVVSIIQFMYFELRGDHLGGVFPTESGGNSYTNIFFLIIIVKSVVFYLGKKESLLSCLLKCGTSLLIAALAELKFYFVEFIIAIILTVLFTNFSWRKFWVIVGGASAVVLAAGLLTSLFPNFAGWFSLEWFVETAMSDKGYTSSGDLNRLNAIPQINKLWLKTWDQRLFGLGLGNCDTSNFAFINTPFFEKYGDMHYMWMSYAFWYLETGYIGLVFYFGFFALVYLLIRKIEKNLNGIEQAYCRISRIMCILCMIISVYNSSLRTEAGYMAYFVLAIPFVLKRAHMEARKTHAETVVEKNHAEGKI